MVTAPVPDRLRKERGGKGGGMGGIDWSLKELSFIFVHRPYGVV